jgi:hypothetical protein
VVRLQPRDLALLDAWMVEQDDILENRQLAIRGLITLVFGEGKRSLYTEDEARTQTVSVLVFKKYVATARKGRAFFAIVFASLAGGLRPILGAIGRTRLA